MHWPMADEEGAAFGNSLPFDSEPTFSQTWTDMEKLLDSGKVKAIGVSNFSIKNLDILLKTAKVVPAVNQVSSKRALVTNATRC